MAEKATWTGVKTVAAVCAGLSVLALMLPANAVQALSFGVDPAALELWYTLVLSAIVLLCSAVLYREVASLKITVVLLTLGMFLVFAGTLAQTRLGIWEVIDTWFRGRVVNVHVELFTSLFDKSMHSKELSGLWFPFPGGFLILGLLTINMTAAMCAKIRSDWSSSARGLLLRRHAGIYVLHVGLLIMFAGEFVTGLYADEGRLAIQVDSWTDFVEDNITTELAFVDRSDPERDKHVVIPQALLQKHAVIDGDGEVISHDELPFDLRVEAFMRNAEFSPSEGLASMRGAARFIKAEEIPPFPGTETERSDTPAVYVSLLDKEDGRLIGTWLCAAQPELLKLRDDLKPLAERPDMIARAGMPSMQLSIPLGFPQDTSPGMPEVELRFARRYLDYRVHLEKVDHDTYDGTTIPHNFSSDVRIAGGDGTPERKSHIWMNNPLRYDGKAFYQHQMNAGAGLTVLQVVNNPGIWLPYISCGVVTLGLLMQFGMSLFSYTRRSVR